MTRVLLCLLASLALPAGADSRVTIALLPEAQVAGPAIQLGEIARLRSPDLELMRHLVSLEVGPAPRPGETAAIQARHLAAWIERQVGVRVDEVDWAGARESRIERHATRVRGEEIARVAQSEIRAMQRRAGLAEEATVASVPRDLHVPRGAVRLQARVAGGAQLGARALVWVDVWVAEAFVRSVPVSLRVPGMEPTRAMQHPAVPMVDASAGRLAVERGETAALRTVAGAVQLESRVQVLQDGRVGDLVRVRQQGATALLSARVIGPGQVEVAP